LNSITGTIAATALTDYDPAKRSHIQVSRYSGGQIMAINFVPLHDRVLVRRVEEQETTQGGLIIPDTAKDKPQEGEVLATGKGKVKDDGTVLPLDVKTGDRILFGKYAGNDININGEEYLIMREDDVLGITVRSGKRAKEAA
jgi:chaperonin GroES